MVSLEKRNLNKAYNDIFHQQETEEVIEKIEITLQDLQKYIWIPHRLVVKSDQQLTMKIRSIFSCSCLNCYSYLSLINTFYLETYEKLFSWSNSNPRRTKTRMGTSNCFHNTFLIFGFNANPFILNYVLKYLVSLFPNTEEIISSV